MGWLGCLTGHQEVSRCGTRGESEESIVCRWWSIQARESTLALIPRCPEVQQKGFMSFKFFLENLHKCIINALNWPLVRSSNVPSTFIQIWSFSNFSSFPKFGPNSIWSRSQVGEGLETWNLCRRLWQPSFLWLILQARVGEGMAPPDPLLPHHPVH